jgi:hypothetical protein
VSSEHCGKNEDCQKEQMIDYDQHQEPRIRNLMLTIGTEVNGQDIQREMAGPLRIC